MLVLSQALYTPGRPALVARVWQRKSARGRPVKLLGLSTALPRSPSNTALVTKTKRSWDLQSAEQPSPSVWLLSSQASPARELVMPSPQVGAVQLSSQVSDWAPESQGS